MDYPEITPLEELSGPFALLLKGPKFLTAWLGKRSEDRYREFTRAALEGDVFPENAKAMTSEDLLAMLRALEMDIEAELQWEGNHGFMAGTTALRQKNSRRQPRNSLDYPSS